MQTRLSVMGQVAQSITDPAKRRELLDSLFQSQPLDFDNNRSRDIFDLLLFMKDELTPAEILAYLNKQDNHGNTIAMARANDPEDRKHYLSLLTYLNKAGISAQDIINHLLITNYQGKTIAHLFPAEELTDLFCDLREQPINLNSLHHLLSQNDNNGTNFIDSLIKSAESKTEVIHQLLSRKIIPENQYRKMADCLEPLLKDNKTPLYAFALAAAKELTRREITNTSLEKDHWNSGYRIQPSKKRTEFIRWLANSSLPATIKFACLDVKAKPKGVADIKNLDGCLHADDDLAYINLLSTLTTTATVKEVLTQLGRFHLDDNSQTDARIAHLKLLEQLLDCGASPQDIENTISGNNILGRNYTFDLEQAYLSFLEKLVSKSASHTTLSKITNKAMGLVELGKIIYLATETLAKRYIQLLQSIASMGKDAAQWVATILLSSFGFPERTVLISLVENKTTLIPDLVDLLITMKNNGVTLEKTHQILKFGDNKDYHATIPAQVLVEHARKDPSLLFKLINHDLLPEQYVKQLKREKETLLKYILEKLPLKERVLALFNATTTNLVEPHPLYRFMALRRGFTKTQHYAGTILKINRELTKEILSDKDNFINPICNIFIDCAQNDNPKQAIHIRFALGNLATQAHEDEQVKMPDWRILLKLLKHDLIPPSYYPEITKRQYVCSGLLRYIQHLPAEKKAAVLIEAHTNDTPLQKLLATNSALHAAIKAERDKPFGDQEKIAAEIKAAKVKRKEPPESVKEPEPVRVPIKTPINNPVPVRVVPPSYQEATNLAAQPSAPPPSPARVQPPSRPATPLSDAQAALLWMRMPAAPMDAPNEQEEEQREERSAMLA